MEEGEAATGAALEGSTLAGEDSAVALGSTDTVVGAPVPATEREEGEGTSTVAHLVADQVGKAVEQPEMAAVELRDALGHLAESSPGPGADPASEVEPFADSSLKGIIEASPSQTVVLSHEDVAERNQEICALAGKTPATTMLVDFESCRDADFVAREESRDSAVTKNPGSTEDVFWLADNMRYRLRARRKSAVPTYEAPLTRLPHQKRSKTTKSAEAAAAAASPDDSRLRPLSIATDRALTRAEELAATKKSLSRNDLLNLGWSVERVDAYLGMHKNPNSYYFRFNAPGEAQRCDAWSHEEEKFFAEVTAEGVDLQWGILSQVFPGRVGYQVACHYNTLKEAGKLTDQQLVIVEGISQRIVNERCGDKPDRASVTSTTRKVLSGLTGTKRVSEKSRSVRADPEQVPPPSKPGLQAAPGLAKRPAPGLAKRPAPAPARAKKPVSVVKSPLTQDHLKKPLLSALPPLLGSTIVTKPRADNLRALLEAPGPGFAIASMSDLVPLRRACDDAEVVRFTNLLALVLKLYVTKLKRICESEPELRTREAMDNLSRAVDYLNRRTRSIALDSDDDQAFLEIQVSTLEPIFKQVTEDMELHISYDRFQLVIGAHQLPAYLRSAIGVIRSLVNSINPELIAYDEVFFIMSIPRSNTQRFEVQAAHMDYKIFAGPVVNLDDDFISDYGGRVDHLFDKGVDLGRKPPLSCIGALHKAITILVSPGSDILPRVWMRTFDPRVSSEERIARGEQSEKNVRAEVKRLMGNGGQPVRLVIPAYHYIIFSGLLVHAGDVYEEEEDFPVRFFMYFFYKEDGDVGDYTFALSEIKGAEALVNAFAEISWRQKRVE